MIAREGRSIHFGDFHGQWNAAEDELALLVAGLWRHGYDFTAFQSPDRQEALRATVERNRIPLRIFPGREYMYDWGHLTTVGTTGDAPPINDPDVESVLRWFKANSEWVVLAHPYAFMVDRLESLLDAGLLDAVELVNGPLDSNNNRKLIDWYASLLNRGKRVPIVSGLDIHVPVGDRRPDVLYDDAYPTSLDIPLLGANRTGVIADRCDVNAVRAAIADGRTFIEIPSERMLVGPPDIVAWLERNDYWAEVEAEQGRRCRFTPRSQRRFIGGSTVSLDCAGFTGLVGIDGREQAVPASGRVALPVPLKTPRDTQYVTLVGRDADAVSVAALKVFHPLQVQAAPRLANGRYQTVTDVANVGGETIEDLVLTLSGCGIRVEERLPPLAPNGVMRRVHTWTVPEPARPTPFHVAIGNGAAKRNRISRACSSCPSISFRPCSRFRAIASGSTWSFSTTTERASRLRCNGRCMPSGISARPGTFPTAELGPGSSWAPPRRPDSATSLPVRRPLRRHRSRRGRPRSRFGWRC